MGKITKSNIDQYKQNRISLVVKDLEYFVPEEVVRKVLLKRGINKWLYCRKKFIELKDDLKIETTKILKEMGEVKRQRKDVSESLKKIDISIPFVQGYFIEDNHYVSNNIKKEILKKQLYKLCKQYDKLVGQLKATSEIKEQIRAICHSSRWQFPK